MAGIARQSPPVGRNRVVRLLQLLVHQAQIVVGVRIIRRERESLAERRQGILQAPGIAVEIAEIEMRQPMVGMRRQQLMVASNRVLRLSLLCKRVAQIEQDIGIVGRLDGGFAQRGHALGELALGCKRDAEPHVQKPVRCSQGERPCKCRFGRGVILQREAGQSQILQYPGVSWTALQRPIDQRGGVPGVSAMRRSTPMRCKASGCCGACRSTSPHSRSAPARSRA